MVRVGLLYDYYGPLLTKRQRQVIDLYYLQNWSLQEIAEAWRTSRQAVHDLVTRAARQLDGYEERLGLEARERRMRAILTDCAAKLAAMRDSLGCDESRALALLTEAEAAVADLLGPEEDTGGG